MNISAATTSKPLTLCIYRVFLPFAAGYFLSYLYRVVNAIIATNLTGDLGINPSDLGMLTSIYFISFASSQLPLGVLLDRFGPRRVESLLLLFAALGAFLFAKAGNLADLVIGRAFIGFGVSACLMAAFKAYTLWFAKEKWPLINGLQMAAGGLGAVAATAPVEKALQFTDWRTVFLCLALLTLLSSAIIFFIVPEKNHQPAKETLADQLRGILEVFTNRTFWRTAPLTTMSQAIFMAIQGLWAGPWLTHIGKYPRPEVGRILFWVAVAMIAGFVILGTLAERLGKRGVSATTTAVIGMTIFMVLQILLLYNPEGWAIPLWIGFGFFGTSGVLAYSGLSQAFPIHLSGRVTTALNLLVFVAAFISQWFIGLVINSFISGNELPITSTGFNVGVGILFVVESATLIHYLLNGPKKLQAMRP